MPTPLTPKAHPRLPPLTAAQRVLFEDARQRIATEQTWCQLELAHTTRCKPCDPNSRDAATWCCIGTLMRTLGVEDIYATPLSQMLFRRLFLTVERLLDDDRFPFAVINDNRLVTAQLPPSWATLTPHQRVLAVYDEVLRS